MLVLTRKPGERLLVGADIVFEVMEVSGKRVKIGINAPAQVRVIREELRYPLMNVLVRKGGLSKEMQNAGGNP